MFPVNWLGCLVAVYPDNGTHSKAFIETCIFVVKFDTATYKCPQARALYFTCATLTTRFFCPFLSLLLSVNCSTPFTKEDR